MASKFIGLIKLIRLTGCKITLHRFLLFEDEDEYDGRGRFEKFAIDSAELVAGRYPKSEIRA